MTIARVVTQCFAIQTRRRIVIERDLHTEKKSIFGPVEVNWDRETVIMCKL